MGTAAMNGGNTVNSAELFDPSLPTTEANACSLRFGEGPRRGFIQCLFRWIGAHLRNILRCPLQQTIAA